MESELVVTNIFKTAREIIFHGRVFTAEVRYFRTQF